MPTYPRPVRSPGWGALLVGAVLAPLIGCASVTGAEGVAADAAVRALPSEATPATTDLQGVRVPELHWHACGDGLECAQAELPLDYDRPGGPTVELALVRHPATDQAHRIGSVFVNPGGPGASGVEFLRTAPPGALDTFPQFDLVGWDPRGIGSSRPVVDCTTDAEDEASVEGRFTRPDTADRRALVAQARAFTRGCERRNPAILPHLATADTARDLDVLRAAVGDEQLTYVGISHGTHIGATYASLFPDRVRAMVADSPIDADAWVNRPTVALRELAAANQRGMLRFFAACAAAGSRCGFGGEDPQAAYEDLVAAANDAPVSAPGSATGTPVSGDEAMLTSTELVIAKSSWPDLARALAEMESGDASLMRELSDALRGRHPDHTWDPSGAFFTTTAQDWRTPRDVDAYLEEGQHLSGLFPTQWFQGLEYGDIAYATYRVTGHDAFRGPYTYPVAAAPAMVIGVTHDARTPYRWAERYVGQLGNARLMTYRGDGHGALTDLNPCVIVATIQYVTDLTVPAEGATCTQDYAAFPTVQTRKRSTRTWPVDAGWGLLRWR